MLGMFASVKPYLAPKRKVDVPRPDNIVFKLHYKVTFALLIVATIMVSSYAYIDSSTSPIQCMLDKGVSVPNVVINRFCWIMSTFTLPKHFEGSRGEDFLHFGVGPMKDNDDRVYHAYYQWIPVVLSLQAVMFYFPHWLWKNIEGGRMRKIITGLNNTINDDDERQEKVNKLAEYMRTRAKVTNEHQAWASKFFMCECLNFVNVIAQMFITNSFLGGEFTTYGTEVLNFPYMEPENRVDPMSRIFPRMTKCSFRKYGGSGTIERLDALCVLSMNIVNEKIYIFLWFWFIILAVLTGVNLILRLAELCMPNVRQRMVELENIGFLDRTVSKREVETVVEKLSYSDWLILYYLAQAMDKRNFGSLISKMADDLPVYPDDEESGNKTDNEGDENGKSITPPPDFYDASTKSTLKSSNKLTYMLNMMKHKD